MKHNFSISKTGTGTEPVAKPLVTDKQVQSGNAIEDILMQFDPPRAACINSNQRHCIFSQLLSNTFCSPINISDENS